MPNTDNVVIENGDGTYEVRYTIPSRGTYLHSIQVDETYIAVVAGTQGWPVRLNVYSSPTSAAHSVIDPDTPIPFTLLAGTNFTYRILARDALSNPQFYALGIYEGIARTRARHLCSCRVRFTAAVSGTLSLQTPTKIHPSEANFDGSASLEMFGASLSSAA